MTRLTNGVQVQALIHRYIDPDPHGHGPAEANLATYGTAVWALVAYLQAVEGDVDQAARDYRLPREAVEAALAYYQQHRALIDARLLLNTLYRWHGHAGWVQQP